MKNKKVASLDCILKISDDKGRVVISSSTRKTLNITHGSLVELTYLKVENKVVQEFLLPFKDNSQIDAQGRFQTTSVARQYLDLKKGDYFVASVKKYF